jgi:RNA polymerase sigma factor (sigma-70 family)
MQMRRMPVEHGAGPARGARPGVEAAEATGRSDCSGFSASPARFLRDSASPAGLSASPAANPPVPARASRRGGVESPPMQATVTQGCGRDRLAEVREAGDGSRAELVAALYRDAYHRVYAFVRRSVGDIEAEEIAHEAFIRLFRVRNLERMTVSVAYLLRIAENLLKRRHERAARYKVVLEESARAAAAARGEWSTEAGTDGFCEGAVAERSAPSAGIGGLSSDAALDAVLGAMRERLTSEEQAAIRLIVCEGLDYQSAARSLGVPVSTINNWKHRGIAKLKQFIGCDGGRPEGRSFSAAV